MLNFHRLELSLVKTKKVNLERCIICQNISDSKGNKKLTSTYNGRRNLIDYSTILQDNLLNNLNETDLECIKYHVDTCYSRYKRKSDRAKEKKSECSTSSNSAEKEEQGQQELSRSSKKLKFDEKKANTLYYL